MVSQSEAVGHAVRGGYFYAGVADVAALTGDKQYIDAIDRIWQDVIDRKLYLIGSVGQHGAGEGYAGAYQLTNLKAYNETCAAIALALWNHRMFLLHGDAKYVDVLERIIYNGFLSGVSLERRSVLLSEPAGVRHAVQVQPRRAWSGSPWFGCSCCPSNVVRFLPSIPGYVYAVRDRDLYVNLFLAGKATIDLDGDVVAVVQETDYPWNGKIRMTVSPQADGSSPCACGFPAGSAAKCCRAISIATKIATPAEWSLACQRRGGATSSWRTALPCSIASGSRATWSNWICRCRSAACWPTSRSSTTVAVWPSSGVRWSTASKEPTTTARCARCGCPTTFELTPEHRRDLLGGVTVLKGEAAAVYRQEDGTVASRPKPITMIPYYAWCHRGANEMVVWIPRSPELAVVPPLPTIAGKSRVTASHTWQADSDRGRSTIRSSRPTPSDHEIPRFTWWDHRGTAEWVQYDFAEPTTVSSVEVYWFDDTGRGQCRVPQVVETAVSRRRRLETGRSVREFGTSKDGFVEVEFTPVETDALRIEVELQPQFSGGILEWRVHGPGK